MRYARQLPRVDMVSLYHDLGSCSWTVDHAGWVVTLHAPEAQDFSARTLEKGLSWCLVQLMVPELGVGPFLG